MTVTIKQSKPSSKVSSGAELNQGNSKESKSPVKAADCTGELKELVKSQTPKPETVEQEEQVNKRGVPVIKLSNRRATHARALDINEIELFRENEAIKYYELSYGDDDRLAWVPCIRGVRLNLVAVQDKQTKSTRISLFHPTNCQLLGNFSLKDMIVRTDMFPGNRKWIIWTGVCHNSPDKAELGNYGICFINSDMKGLFESTLDLVNFADDGELPDDDDLADFDENNYLNMNSESSQMFYECYDHELKEKMQQIEKSSGEE